MRSAGLVSLLVLAAACSVACSDGPRTTTPPKADAAGFPDATGFPDAAEVMDAGGEADAEVTDAETDAGEPDLDPRIIAFAASPQMVARGETVTIVWNVENAVNLTIVATPGGVVLPDTAVLTGMLTSPPLDQATTFALTARAASGRIATQLLSVGVDPGNPVIVSFVATPIAVAAGEMSTLSWQTENATSVRIVQGATTLFVAPTGMIEMGQFMSGPLAGGSHPFTLEAANFAHQTTALVVVEAN